MNCNPTAYPGGTSLKPLKIDLIWVLTEPYYKGFTCFFNNTVLRGAGLNGCAIFVRKLWIWLFEDDMFLPTNLGIWLFEDDMFFTFRDCAVFAREFGD